MSHIYALHGMLGLPNDWNALTLPINEAVKLEDFKYDLTRWPSEFNSRVNPAAQNILIGYSMGGRLALHALKDKSALWSRAILISTHTGISAQSEREARILLDEKWARRFETEAWDTLMRDWNGQEVLLSDKTPQRREADYSRYDLSWQFRHWSQGRQEDLREAVAKLPMPILWITGEKDRKYLECMNALSLQHRESKTHVMSNTGHRLLWENPDELNRVINTWLRGIL